MKGKRCAVMIVAMAISCGSRGIVRDTVEINTRASERLSVEKATTELMYRSPISIIRQYTTPLAKVEAHYVYGASTLTPIGEFGGGVNAVGGRIQGYLSIRGSYVSGDLEYMDGQVRKVGGCLSAQPEVLMPIVEGDTVEHDIHRSALNVNATFARDMAYWAIGLGLSCKAIHESDSDPISPKNFSCDMKAQIALAKLADRYRIGAEVGLRKFTEDDDVRGGAGAGKEVMLRKGLGQWSHLSRVDLEEDGSGVEIAGFVMPRRGYAPLTLTMRYGTMSISTKADTTTLVRMRTRQFATEASYKMRAGGLIRRLQIDLGIDQSRSREGSDYDKDAPRMTGTIVGGGWGAKGMIEVGVEAGFGKWRERAGDLTERIEACAVKGGTTFVMKRQSGAVLSALTGELGMEIVTNEKTSVDGASPFAEYVSRRAKYLSSNRYKASLSIPIQIQVGRTVGLIVTPSLRSERHSGGEASRRVDFRIGMTF
ncbi:MAG: hypothetical protein II951_08125 [Bacteroidales bacterium]|nr:hypothetical protein [Bacteroidales bacterium]